MSVVTATLRIGSLRHLRRRPSTNGCARCSADLAWVPRDAMVACNDVTAVVGGVCGGRAAAWEAVRRLRDKVPKHGRRLQGKCNIAALVVPLSVAGTFATRCCDAKMAIAVMSTYCLLK
jgi:hypothetical protein